ncbi:sulfotransferase [Pseudoalteromonas sp. '520P1 No. 423']|uniref:sulfotransferase n=1 Tax=unclassified Pseudoalteromonas TaxID=194690 RepID=UPI0035294D47
MTEQKIFIIGLPRTATTSVCAAMLELGFKTAHTAYTNQSMNDAQVIADTPVFCDYQLLDKTYPNAKFIYLQRDSTVWLPSIRQLLIRMYKNLQRTDGGFNPTLKRCYNDIFSPLTLENIENDDFLQSCYDRHQQGINEYFKGREQDLLQIDVSDKNSFDSLLAFLEIDTIQTQLTGFERINIGGKVTAWKQIKNPLKIEATQKGKVDRVRP